jgi:hypothetical protein
MKSRRNQFVSLFVLALLIGAGSRWGRRAEGLVEPAAPGTPLGESAHRPLPFTSLRPSEPRKLEGAAARAPENWSRVRLARERFAYLATLKRNVRKRELREAELERLRHDPAALAESRSILADLARTRELYGPDQAAARVYSIELLALAARRGEPAPLEGALRDTYAQLRGSSSRERGQEQDFSELLGAWIELRGSEAIRLNPDLLFSAFPFDPSLRQAYVVALYNVYGARKSEPGFSPRMSQILRGEKS